MRLYVEEVLNGRRKDFRLRSRSGKIKAVVVSGRSLLWWSLQLVGAERGIRIPLPRWLSIMAGISGREAIWGDPWPGRKLTPLEEEARSMDFVWGRVGQYWVIRICIHVGTSFDGIIYFLQWGCPTSNTLGKSLRYCQRKNWAYRHF